VRPPLRLALALLLLARPGRGDDPAQLERGEAVMKSFCLSCHGREGKNPLQPRLDPEAWGNPERAYQNIGRLSQIQPRMDQPFTRSDEDRRALASYLAHLAQENRRPFWLAAAPYAALAAVVAAAGAFFLRSLKRNRAA